MIVRCPSKCLPRSMSHLLTIVVLAAGSIATQAQTAAQPAPNASDVSKELQALRERIDQLEAELSLMKATKQQQAMSPKLVNAVATEVVPAPATTAESTTPSAGPVDEPPKPKPAEPFAYADWTWLNGTPRNKDVVWDSKFFTPEIRFDAHYISSFNHPKDDSLGGSTEIFRSNEIQLEHPISEVLLSLGLALVAGEPVNLSLPQPKLPELVACNATACDQRDRKAGNDQCWLR